MEELLAQAKKLAEEAEVFLTTLEETQVQFEANRLKHIQSRQKTTLALRLIKGGRIGYATTTDPSDTQRLLSHALETAPFGTLARFELPQRAEYPKTPVFDPETEAIPIEKMAQLGEELIALVREHTPDIVCEAMVSKTIANLRLINSRGGEASYQKSTFSLSLWGTLIRGTDMLFVGEFQGSCRQEISPKEVAKLVIWQLELAKNQARVPTKELPVIFTPRGVASAIIPSLAMAFNGKIVLEGASPIGHQLGQKVFDPKLSLWDDSTLDYRPNSHPCDDEGIPGQRTPLVKEGIVSNFFYDLQTAALAGSKSTGNAARNGGLPNPSPTNLVIAPGRTSFEEMLADIKEGLLIDQLIGAEQGNVLGGDFSGNVLLGFKIENGKIVGRVKDTMVSGNIYQVLKEIAAIGDKPEWVGISVYTPPIYCPRLAVASK